MQLIKISKKIPIYDKKILLFWRKTKNSFIKYLSKIIDAFDIYYNKEKFGLIKSIYSVIKLSCNFLVKNIYE